LPSTDVRVAPLISLYSDADLRLLTTLHTLLQTCSVTQAAERLGVSQPAVSRTLARARERFQDPLLLRSGGKMILTSRAEGLKTQLAKWLADGQALFSQVEIVPELLNRQYRIASTDYGVFSVIEPSLARLAQEAPHIELSIHPYTPESEGLLASGELDFVIRGGAPDLSRVHARLLYSEHHLALASADHPELVNGSMSVEVFFEQPHVVVRVPTGLAGDYEMEDSGIHRRKLVVSDHFMMAPYLVAGSRNVMTAPSRAALRFADTHRLVAFEPPVPLAGFDYWITWHERTQRDAEIQWLIDYLAQPFSSHPERQQAT